MTCGVTRVCVLPTGSACVYDLSSIAVRSASTSGFSFSLWGNKWNSLIKAAACWAAKEYEIIQYSDRATSRDIEELGNLQCKFIKRLYEFKGYSKPLVRDLKILFEAQNQRKLDFFAVLFRLRRNTQQAAELSPSARSCISAEEFCRSDFHLLYEVISAQNLQVLSAPKVIDIETLAR